MSALHKVLIVDDDPVVARSFDRVLNGKAGKAGASAKSHDLAQLDKPHKPHHVKTASLADILGFNPNSLWGWRQQRAHWCRRLGWRTGPGQLFLPEAGDFIGQWRLRDWLRLLGFEVEVLQLGCYKPAVRSEVWLQRFDWMDRYGPRWWSVLGAVYFVVAVKRVRGMRLLGPAWKPRRVAAAPVAVVQRPSVGAMHGDSSA